MVLIIDHMHSDSDGTAKISEDTIVFTSDDSGNMRPNAMKISRAQPCKRAFYVELPPGYRSDARIVDRDQLVVCLEGRIMLFADDNVGKEMGPGSVLKVSHGPLSHHVLEVIGDGPSRFMIVQID